MRTLPIFYPNFLPHASFFDTTYEFYTFPRFERSMCHVLTLLSLHIPSIFIFQIFHICAYMHIHVHTRVRDIVVIYQWRAFAPIYTRLNMFVDAYIYFIYPCHVRFHPVHTPFFVLACLCTCTYRFLTRSYMRTLPIFYPNFLPHAYFFDTIYEFYTFPRFESTICHVLTLLSLHIPSFFIFAFKYSRYMCIHAYTCTYLRA